MSLKDTVAQTLIDQKAIPRESHERIYRKADDSRFGFIMVLFAMLLVGAAVILLAQKLIGVWILLLLLLMALILVALGSFYISREIAQVAWKVILEGVIKIIPLIRRRNGTPNSRTNTSSGGETGPT